MISFSPEQWAILGFVAGAGLLAMLYAIATKIRNELYVHNHLIECAKVRDEFVRATQAHQRDAITSRDVELVETID